MKIIIHVIMDEVDNEDNIHVIMDEVDNYTCNNVWSS